MMNSTPTSWLQKLGTGLALATIMFLVTPVLIVLPMSVSDTNYLSFPPRSFTLRWFHDVVNLQQWRRPILFSAQIALCAALFSTVVGTLTAYSLARGTFAGRSWIQMLVIAPIIVPNIVIAVAIYFAYVDARLIGSLPGFVMAHALLCIPFVVLTVTASLTRFDAGLELAAMSCGASRWKAFWLVTLPNIWPGVTAGGVFSFITSFDEPVISYFISSIRQATLPRVMFQNIETQVKPDVAAIGTLMIAASVAVVLIYLIGARRRGG